MSASSRQRPCGHKRDRYEYIHPVSLAMCRCPSSFRRSLRHSDFWGRTCRDLAGTPPSLTGSDPRWRGASNKSPSAMLKISPSRVTFTPVIGLPSFGRLISTQKPLIRSAVSPGTGRGNTRSTLSIHRRIVPQYLAPDACPITVAKIDRCYCLAGQTQAPNVKVSVLKRMASPRR